MSDVIIQNHWPINPNNPSQRREVICPDFLKKYAIIEQLIIENGSLLFNKYTESEYKIHINSNKGVIIEGGTPIISFKNTAGDITTLLVSNSIYFQVKQNDVSLLKIDGQGTTFNTDIYAHTVHATSLFVNGVDINQKISTNNSNLDQQIENVTSNKISDYNDNIIEPNYYNKTQADQLHQNLIDDHALRKDQSDHPDQNDVYELGSENYKWNKIYATSFYGNVVNQGADLAEKYTILPSDRNIEIGDVIIICSDENADCEISNNIGMFSVLGVISSDENAAIIMNNKLEEGYPIALKGRVKCKVKGPVVKGEPLISYYNGCAIGVFNDESKVYTHTPGVIFGKTLEEINDESIQLIEIVVL